MTKLIKYSKKANKELRTIPQNIKSRIIGKINLLATNPEQLANNIKKLQGVTDSYRLRVGDYRVIYTEDYIVIEIVKIAPRGKAY